MENTMMIDRGGPPNVANGVIRRVGRNDGYSEVINLPKVWYGLLFAPY